MFVISNLCILCLSYKNLKTILLEDNEGRVIKKKLTYCLPEIVDSQLDVQEYMCVNCLNKLDCFYEFKQCCLQKNTYLKNYMQTLTSTGDTYKHLSVKLTDMKHQNTLEAKNKEQTLAIVASDDGGMKDYATCVKNEIECVDVSDIKESHLLSDEEEDIIVKAESVTSENKDDIEFYHKFANSIKRESISSDSNVSVSDNEDEDSDDSINSNAKHNSTEAEKNMVKKTNKYQCAICGKEFLHKKSLEYHLKAHADETTIEDSTFGTNIDVESTDTCKTRAKKEDKRTCCIYCNSMVLKFPRHLNRHHNDEEKVRTMNSLPVKSQQRLQIISELRKRGNFFYNYKCLEQDKGELIVKRRPNKNVKKKSDFLPCANCLGYYSKRTLYRHVKYCDKN